MKKDWPFLLAIVLLAVISLSGYFNTLLPAHDVSSAYLPWAEILKQSITEYKDPWPLYQPYGFAGSPFLMKPVLGLDSLYLITLLLIPNTILAVKLTYVILYIIAGISMFYLAKYLGMESKFAFISALVYMLNGHILKLLYSWWLTTIGGYALLPLAFLWGMKAVQEESWVKNSLIAGIIFALLFRLNPDMKVAYWLFLLYGLYLAFTIATDPKTWKRALFVGAIILLVFAGLSAQRLLPNAEYIQTTSRAETSWEIASGRPLLYEKMWNRLVEPIYEGMPKIRRAQTGDHIGIIAFLLALFIITKKWKNKTVIFFTLGTLFSILVASNSFGLYRLMWEILPFFKSLRYLDRSLFLFVFCGSILAGLGAKEFLQNKKNAWWLGLIALLFLNLWVFNVSPYTDATTSIWSDADLARQNNHVLQYVAKQPGIFRIQTWETRGIDWGTGFWNVPLKLEHIYDYDTSWNPAYMNGYLAVANQNPAKLWGLLNVRYVTSQQPLNSSGLILVNQFPACEECFPSTPEWGKAWGPYLYENLRAMPRAWVVERAVLVLGEPQAVTQATYSLMLSAAFDPWKIVFLKDADISEVDAVLLVSQPSQEQLARLQDFVKKGGKVLPDVFAGKTEVSGEEIEAYFTSFPQGKAVNDSGIMTLSFSRKEIDVEGEGWLVLSELYSQYKGWDVKGATGEKELLAANEMLTTVRLDGAEGTVVFTYAPRSVFWGRIITLFSIIVIAFLLWRLRQKRGEVHEGMAAAQ